jgi:hypothetical protein
MVEILYFAQDDTCELVCLRKRVELRTTPASWRELQGDANDDCGAMRLCVDRLPRWGTQKAAPAQKEQRLNLIKQQPYSYRNSLSHETGELQVCRHYGWHNSQRYVEE